VSMRADTVPFAWAEGLVTRISLNLQESGHPSDEMALAHNGRWHRRDMVLACMAFEGSDAMVGKPSMDKSELGNSLKAHLFMRRHSNLAVGHLLAARMFGVDEAQLKSGSWV
jgi:hypothetical protein